MSARAARIALVMASAIATTLAGAAAAYAVVAGTPPSQAGKWKLFGSFAVAGNTLMEICDFSPVVNCTLMSGSDAQVKGIPADAQVEKAYIWWTGSVEGFPDTDADLTLADGRRFAGLAADGACLTTNVFGGFYYCRRDVTDLVGSQALGSYNGTYRLEGVSAKPGFCPDNIPPSDPRFDVNCQARYAGWAIVVVYSSPSFAINREVILYDGFLQLDETETSAGIASPIVIGGFEVGAPARAEFTFFGLEGDKQLGVPPQNLDPQSPIYCPSCHDFIRFNGAKLTNATNPENNIWNSTVEGTGTVGVGVDLDTFSVGENGSGLLKTGDTTATIQPGTGDGLVPNDNPVAGGGESVFLGFMLLALDSVAPDFNNTRTEKTVDRLQAGAGEILTYTIRITNDGTEIARNVIVSDAIPQGTSYVPNSTATNCGIPAPDQGSKSILEAGLNIGNLNFVGGSGGGGESCTIQFQVRIHPDTQEGTEINNTAVLRADGLQPRILGPATTRVTKPPLQVPTKTVQDINGGATVPGDILEYVIGINNLGTQDALSLTFVDLLPPHLTVTEVFPPGGVNLSAGNEIRIEELAVPSGGDLIVRFRARVDTEEEFAVTEPSAEVDGYAICNQGRYEAVSLQTPLYTDNPGSLTPQDPTCVILDLPGGPELRTSSKRVNGGSGRKVKVNELLTYTLTVRNTGDRLAHNCFLADDIPPNAFLTVTDPGGGTISPGPNGSVRVRWDLGNLSAGAAAKALTLKAAVSAGVPHGAVLSNQAKVICDEFPQGISTDDPDTAAPGDATVVFADTAPNFSTSTKAVSGLINGEARPGQRINFAFRVRNTGAAPASDITIEDVLDALLDDVQDILPTGAGAYDPLRRTVTWKFPSLGVAPDELSLGFSARVRAPGGPEAIVKNVALVSAKDREATPTNEIQFRVRDAPFFGDSTKEAIDPDGDNIYAPGQAIAYRITVINQSSVTAQTVIVTDRVDGVLLVNPQSTDASAQVSGNQVRWSLETVPPGDRRILTLTAVIAANAPDGAKVSNQARIESLGVGDPFLSDDPATPDVIGDATVVAVSSRPKLEAEKSFENIDEPSFGNARPGQRLLYRIKLRNIGQAVALQVRVEDILHPDLQVADIQNGGIFDASTRMLKWDASTTPQLARIDPLGIVAPGPNDWQVELTFSAATAATLPNGRVISNQARVFNSQSGATPVLSDDFRRPGPPVTPTDVVIVSAGDVTQSGKDVLAKDGVTPISDARPGDTVTYRITVRNTGLQDLPGVTIEDDLNPNLELLPASVSPPASLSGRVLRWTAGALPAGASAIYEFKVVVRPLTAKEITIGNRATIRSTALADPFFIDANEIRVKSADFSGSTKICTARGKPCNGVRPGDTVNFQIRVRNGGSGPSQGVVVTDALDPRLTNPQLIVPAATVAGSTITWNLPQEFMPGNEVVLSVSATIADDVLDKAEIPNQALISAVGFSEPVRTDNPATPEITGDATLVLVNFPDLSTATKTVEAVGSRGFVPGGEVSYAINVSNRGSTAAEDVVVRDQLDQFLEFVSSPDGGRMVSGQVRWDKTRVPSLRRLEPGQEVVLRLNARIKRQAANGIQIANQAFISAKYSLGENPTDDPQTEAMDDPTIFVVTAVPEISAFHLRARDDDGGQVNPGDAITYTINVTNSGESAAHNMQISLPYDPTLLTILPAQGYRLGEGIATWDKTTDAALAELGAGKSWFGGFSARVSGTAANGTPISLQAESVAAEIAGPHKSDDPATDVLGDPTIINVVDMPDLSQTILTVRDENGGDADQGDVLTYTLRVRNTGSRSATGVRVSAPVPAGTKYVRGSTALNGRPVPDASDGRAPIARGIVVQSPVDRAGAGEIIAFDQSPPDDESAVVTYRVRIDASIRHGAIISNHVHILGDGVDVRSDNPKTAEISGDSTNIVIGRGGDISGFYMEYRLIADNGAKGKVDPGDKLEIRMILPNTGNAAITGVLIEQEIPEPLRYVARSLRVNRGLQTDGSDGDAGEVANGQTVRASVSALAAGTVALVEYDVEVLSGPLISLQGVARSAQTGPEPSDSDAAGENGDQPLIIPVLGAAKAVLQASFTAFDENAGALWGGDEVRYVLEARNIGTRTAENVTVQVKFPGSSTVADGSIDIPSGARISTETESHRVTREMLVHGFDIPALGVARIAWRSRVSEDATKGTVIVASGIIKAKNTDGQIQIAPSALIIGGMPGTASIRGVVSWTNGAGDAAGKRERRPLEGFSVTAAAGGDSRMTYSAGTNTNGEYQIVNVKPGSYLLTVLSDTGMEFGSRPIVIETEGIVSQQDFDIWPTGMVYNIADGRPIERAFVVLRYDGEKGDAPVAAAELGAGQQFGQTGRHGLYKLDSPKGHKYRVDIAPGGSGVVFPSVQAPPQERPWDAGSPAAVVAGLLPDIRVAPKYFLRFDQRAASTLPHNNHIPVEPMRNIISLRKTVSKPAVSLGDILTFTVEMKNLSPTPIQMRADGRTGGIYIADIIPPGFKYVENSGTLIRRASSAREKIDPDGSRIMRFGPLEIGGGDAITLLYQIVAGPGVRPGEYDNHAVALGPGGERYSEMSSARFRVDRDPIFDRGHVVGKVFCDRNENGKQDHGETGVFHARVYHSGGFYAETDGHGRYHFSYIDAGYHLFKLDTNTLTPGDVALEPVTMGLYVSRGLPVKANFGVSCSRTSAGPDDFSAVTPAPLSYVYEIAGSLERSNISIGGEQIDPPAVDVKATHVAAGIETTVDYADLTGQQYYLEGGKFDPQIAFVSAVSGVKTLRSWSIIVTNSAGSELHRMAGEGVPPRVAFWDGKNSRGDPLGAAARRMKYFMEIVDENGDRYHSPARPMEIIFRETSGATAGPQSIEDPEDGSSKEEHFADGGIASMGDPAPHDNSNGARGIQAIEFRSEVIVNDKAITADETGQFSTLVELFPESELNIVMTGANGVRSFVRRTIDINGDIVIPATHERAVRRIDASLRGSQPGMVAEFNIGGNVRSNRLYVNGSETVDLIEPPGISVQGDRELDSAGTENIVFVLEDLPARGVRYLAQVTDELGNVVWEANGQGMPPRALRWNAGAPGAVRMLKPGYYRSKLTVTTADGEFTSRAQQIYIRRPREFEDILISRAAIIARDGSLTARGRVQLRGVADMYVSENYDRIEVCLAGKEPDIRTAPRNQTDQLSAAVITGVFEERGVRLANISVRQGCNRKEAEVLVRLVREDSGQHLEPRPPSNAKVELAGANVPVEKSGAFAARVRAALGERLLVALSRPDGSEIRQMVSLDGAAAPVRLAEQPRAAWQRNLEGESTASQIELSLPPDGTIIKAPYLAISGKAHAENRVSINGEYVAPDGNGEFHTVVQLAEGSADVVLISTDKLGNVAKIKRTYIVDSDSIFILALAEAAAGAHGSELEGMNGDSLWYPATLNDAIYLHGRGLVYFKGRMKGSAIFKQYQLTVHADSSKEKERDLFEQIIDPDRYYPIYGDDGNEVKDVNSRGKLYVLLEADHSKALFGNFQTGIRGLELLAYDRTLYGGIADFNESIGPFQTRLQGFGAESGRMTLPRRLEFSGTGGTLFYLRDTNILEGSESVSIIVRDRQTGLVLTETPLSRDIDFTIDYRQGRMFFQKPVPSVSAVRDTMIRAPGIGAVGHPVFVAVNYEYEQPDDGAASAWGVHASETFFDTVSLGGGYIYEGRSGGPADAYRLWGTHAEIKISPNNIIRGEFARTVNHDRSHYFSDNGGITFSSTQVVSLSENPYSEDSGSAFKLDARGEIAELLGKSQDKFVKYDAYYQQLDSGFSTNASLVEQGMRKYGGGVEWYLDDHSSLLAHHDGLDTGIVYPGQGVRLIGRDLTRLQYRSQLAKHHLAGEYGHYYLFDGQLPPGAHNDLVAGGYGYDWNERWFTFLEQEMVPNGDSRLYPEAGDRLTTSIGFQYRYRSEITLGASESVNYSGDNATILSAKAAWSESSNIYGSESFAAQNRRLLSTSVVGADGAPAEGSRHYGEYQMDAAPQGQIARGVLGMTNRIEANAGTVLSLNYEHVQVAGASVALLAPRPISGPRLMGPPSAASPAAAPYPQDPQTQWATVNALGNLSDPLAVVSGINVPLGAQLGDSTRDAISTGLELFRFKPLILSARQEFRYDNSDETLGGQDRMQFVSANSGNLRISEALVTVLRANYAYTENRSLDARESELLELSGGFAVRPVETDWFNMLVKYSKVFEMRPLDLTYGIATESASDVVSVAPIFETPIRVQLTGKLAWKRTYENVADLEGVSSHTWLAISRANLHLYRRMFDLGAEYRVLANTLAQETLNGWLGELSFAPRPFVRIGTGYNFTSFSDNIFDRNSYDHGGFFFRLTGQY